MAIVDIQKDSDAQNADLFCTTRDIFQARIDSYARSTKKYMETAVIGEIGNNTFDHNWDYENGKMRGAYFNPDFLKTYVLLADFGRGIKTSLEKVFKTDSDILAVETAFTKQISGRAPEQRGNGLKFVLDTMIKNKWDLFFQSGNGSCIIYNGAVSFEKQDTFFHGCLAILVFG